MAKILGLDLGTNSIGWAVVDETEEKSILNKGVRIFSEGVKIEKGVESSKASERTGYRSARRIKFRRKLRKYQTLKVLIENKMCPLSFEELENWKQNKIYPKNEDFINWLRTHEDKNPYFFRNLVSKEKLDLENESERFMLGRAFYHLAQRRGFKSNRLDQSEETNEIENYKPIWNAIVEKSNNITELILNFNNYLDTEEVEDKKVNTVLSKLKKMILYLKKSKNEGFETEKDKFLRIINKEEKLGTVKQSIKELSQKITDANCETLGQYFYLEYLKSNKIRNNYTHREDHYEKEFYTICAKQEFDDKLIKSLYDAIFFQRPLRSQKGLVGKCTFEPNKARSPISHPLFEIYRMLAFINNIKYKISKNEKDSCKFGGCKQLNEEQKNVIVDLFFRKSKPQFDFKDIQKAIEKHEGKKLALNYPHYTTVTACPITAALKLVFTDKKEWKNYSFLEKINFYKNIHFPKLSTKKGEHLFAVWHVLFSFEDKKKIVEFAKEKLELDDIKANQLSNIVPKQGYASLSIKAIRKILKFLEKGLIFTHATFLANMQEVVGKEIWQDEIKQKEIITGIVEIIENHGFENKRLLAVNSLLKTCFDNNYTYSIEAESEYKKDIEKNLNRDLGKFTWDKIENKNEIIENSLDNFITLIDKRKFAKIKRTDEKIFDFLKGENSTGEIFCSDEKRLKKLYHPSDVDMYKKARVEEDGKKYMSSPRTESVKNPVAMKTLHQVRHLINALIKENIIDQDTKIHIELAREMNDANVRKAIESWQRDNQKKRDKYKVEIEELYKSETGKEIEPSQDDILKYQLWEEQKHICVYTGKTIKISDFIGADPVFDIEHTIARSLSYDNSLENKTLCFNRYNREIKRQKLPAQLENYEKKHTFSTNAGDLKCEAILPIIEHWKIKYETLDKQIQQKVKQSRAAQTKDAKDRAIQDRHKLTFERNYWKNKYKRFTTEEVPSGFKNSQINDTRLISKFARAFMKTVFDKVYVINGKTTDEFKRIWGLPPKNRNNHIHHAIDAVTLACITKNKNDLLANYYKDEENYSKPKFRKPWKTFTEDLKNLANDTLIYHVREDNAIKPAKKKVRVRGKIQYKKDKNDNPILDNKGNKIPIYMQGDSIRGSLHKETIYGAIENPNKEDTKNPIKYVVRKKLEAGENGFNTEKELDKIVDKTVLQMIKAQIKANGNFKNTIEDGVFMLKPKRNKKNEIIRDENGIIDFEKDERENFIIGHPIKKVRIYTPSVTSPLHIKKHRDLSKHEYKQHIHVVNDTNYIMAIYEGKNEKGKILRDFEIVNLLDSAEYYKQSREIHKKEYPLVPKTKMKGKVEIDFRYILKTGLLVLFYKDKPSEIWDLEKVDLNRRLYKITQFEPDGRLQFRYHQEAGQDKDLKRSSSVDYNNPHAKLRLSLSNFNALIEGIHFKITDWGEIIEIDN